MKNHLHQLAFSALLLTSNYAVANMQWNGDLPTLKAGHPSLQVWRLNDQPPSPDENKWSPERAELGKKLFADPRLSGTGQSTCLWCHTPERGWSDGIKTSVRFGGEVMPVASPTIINIAYNRSFMWDGRAPSLDKQAYGGQKKGSDINAMSTVEPKVVIERLNNIKGYKEAFAKAYPSLGLTRKSVGYALASFERTVISNNSPFDQWVAGDEQALTAEEVNGFSVFLDKEKGNCATCHNPPNFTDDGFHNIGLAEYGNKKHHPGRGKYRKAKIMDGAFKTPTLRDITMTAPYMHDGSLATLEDVIDHYVEGGAVKTNLSPDMKTELKLNDIEKRNLLAFLRTLTSPQKIFIYPVLPQE